MKNLFTNLMTRLPQTLSCLVSQGSTTSSNGSSLIFVMLIVAGIVTVTLGTQRLALVQFGQSVADEDNVSAYYAAKAGIEDGLVRFRFNRNADTIQAAGDPTTDSLTAERYDLTTGVAVHSTGSGLAANYVKDGTPITAADAYSPTQQYYDLKIAYRVSSLTNVILAQDADYELTGFPDSTNDYYLRYQFSWAAGQSGCSATIQAIAQTASGTQVQPQVVVNQVGNSAYDSAAQGTNLLIRTGLGGGSDAATVRIRPLAGGSCTNGAITAAFSTVSGSTGNTAANIDFDSAQTKITATGYFGTTKRTLLATIDRQSGTLISVYDFGLYAGGNGVSGQGNVTP